MIIPLRLYCNTDIKLFVTNWMDLFGRVLLIILDKHLYDPWKAYHKMLVCYGYIVIVIYICRKNNSGIVRQVVIWHHACLIFIIFPWPIYFNNIQKSLLKSSVNCVYSDGQWNSSRTDMLRYTSQIKCWLMLIRRFPIFD